MQKLIYKIEISVGAKFAIEKLGGIKLSEKFLVLNKTFLEIPLVNEEINNELICFLQSIETPPLVFQRFTEILTFYYESESKLTKEKIDIIIDRYNSKINLSFYEFYKNCSLITEKEIKDNYGFGGVSAFKICSILQQTCKFSEYVNDLRDYEPSELSPNESTSILEEFIFKEIPLNNYLLNVIVKICHDYNTAIYCLFDSEFISFIETTLNEIEISNFRNCRLEIAKFITSLTKKTNINNNSLVQIKSEIKLLHSTLLDKYSILIETTPDEQIIKKEKLRSKLENIIKLFNAFERD